MAIEPESFDELLKRLEPDCSNPQEAYKRFRQRLVRFFQWRNCEDAEGHADDTVARLVKKQAEGLQIRADKPYAYVYKIALNVFREYLRDKKNAEELKKHWKPPIYAADQYRLCTKQCLERMAGDRRELLERYYLSNETRGTMAGDLGISVGALRLRIHRIKADLQDCYKQCRGE